MKRQVFKNVRTEDVDHISLPPTPLQNGHTELVKERRGSMTFSYIPWSSS